MSAARNLRIQEVPYEPDQPTPELLPRVSATVADQIGNIRRHAEVVLENAYLHSANAVGTLTRRVRREWHDMKQERPWQLLAMIAGTAFLLGVATRLRRSSRT